MQDKNKTGAQDVEAKLLTFSDTYRDTALQLHALIMDTAPSLLPRLWYGMPGYAAKKDGPVVVFFREDKYISFGLTDSTNLAEIGDPNDGVVEVAWYLTKLDETSKAKITDIIQKITA